MPALHVGAQADSTEPARNPRFALDRANTIERLIRAGIGADLATALIDAWDLSTADLPAFRSAGDFWQTGYAFAIEEYRRGYRLPSASRASDLLPDPGPLGTRGQADGRTAHRGHPAKETAHLNL